ncbi:MAG: GNAT family N-acetyltransferase [Candidatus Kariarchaeaceae archaeon]|jgi:ribosomal-protein-alanine N-acetyltransferase
MKLKQGQIAQFDLKRDKSGILRIEIERFDDPMSPNMVNYLISKYGEQFFYVVDLNGDQHINGFLFAGIEKPHELHIFSIAIQSEFESQGWGTRLMSHLISNASFNKIEKIGLHVETNNIRALNLYQKFGFKEVNISSNYYGKNRDAIIMELLL